MAIKVIVYRNGKSDSGHKVQLGWCSDVIYTNNQGEAIFHDVPTQNHTVFVDKRKVIDGVYRPNGVYEVFL